MARNELVRWRSALPPNETETESEWDLPPVPLSPGRTRGTTLQESEQDARDARQRGDGTFAVLRETDSREKTQSRWDWGDLRTWLILAAMFFGFLAFVAFVYFLPQGRHASPSNIRVY